VHFEAVVISFDIGPVGLIFAAEKVVVAVLPIAAGLGRFGLERGPVPRLRFGMLVRTLLV
jgi:hypothetical protein